MITADQFSNLPDDLLVVFSSKQDGSVLDRSKELHDPAMVQNRARICEAAGVSYDDVVYQRIIYDEHASYSLIVDVDERSTTKYTPEVVADALFTKQAGVGLFLPVADCIVTVIYNPKLRFLAQLHMGRHSTLTDILPRMIDKFKDLGSNPSDLRAWMAPAATRASYKLEYFDDANSPEWLPFLDKRDDGYYLDMQGYNRQVLLDAGLVTGNITISPIDTTTSDNYFSHSRGDTTARFAGLAMMR